MTQPPSREARVYTGGTFDLFHAGHANFLQQCARLGSVTVALNTDKFIREFKGKPPAISYSNRKAVLEACRWVDAVVENIGGSDSKPSILMVQPDIIAIGTDWALRDYYRQMGFTQEWLDVYGIQLVYLPYTLGISSTLIRRLGACDTFYNRV